jgi:peptidoglycan/xylan/chitin deacetylase (PgdA/CDA1 family)
MGKLRRLAGRLSRGSRPGTLILLYHRVAEPCTDPWSLSVTPRHFDEHLEVLREHARPIRLQRLSRGLLEGDLPDRSVVVTFDDGYADNLHNAKPLLERHETPATVFLTTGYIGQEREFWWDELDRLLLQPGTLPETLRLSVSGSIYRWELGKAAYYNSEDALRRLRYWRAWGVFRSRYRLYRSLWKLLHPLTEDERRTVLDELLAWANSGPVGRPTHRPLSLKEAAELAQGKLVEIGAHTVTHPALPKLSVASQRDEIQQSKARLEEILGHPVTSFSYPHGYLSEETVAIVREAGFACACSSVADIIRPSTDRFRLPRVVVQDWNGEEFAKRLSRWLNG